MSPTADTPRWGHTECPTGRHSVSVEGRARTGKADLGSIRAQAVTEAVGAAETVQRASMANLEEVPREPPMCRGRRAPLPRLGRNSQQDRRETRGGRCQVKRRKRFKKEGVDDSVKCRQEVKRDKP